MDVDRSVINEILLVCGVIGSSTDKSEIVPVADCLNWLQDLQRALRRDNDQFRPISILIGEWRIVENKLIPLVMSCRYDSNIVITILKILVILTKPLGERAVRSARLVLDVISGKVEDKVIREQIKIRDNALKQSKMLMEYKRIFVHHPSNREKKGEKNKEGGLLSIFVSLLADPLARTGSERTDSDHMTIELVLHLFRNLLCAEPIIKDSIRSAQEAATLHQELICLLERGLALEIILVLSQDIEARENSHYNLLVLEIMHHLFRGQDPTLVATSEARKQRNSSKETGNLLRNIQKKKQKQQSRGLTRHSNFGGTLRVFKNGSQQLASATLHTHFRQQRKEEKTSTIAKKRDRNPVFIGNVNYGSADTCLKKLQSYQLPINLKAEKSLNKFVEAFLTSSFGPLVKSLKNEFRRETARVEGSDYVLYFKMVWFFLRWSRTLNSNNDHGNKINSIGHLIFCMDIFSFKQVLNAIETYHDKKKYSEIAIAVALYREMMQCLYQMRTGEDDTEQIMGFGLMEKLFYGNEPIEKFGQLLARWKEGCFTREYMCDIIELGHVTIKLLDSDTKEVAARGEKKRKTKKNRNAEHENNAVQRIRDALSEFDITSYLTRLITNKMVFMYSKLLGQYAVNTSNINHHIISIFIRMCKTIVYTPESEKAEMHLQTVTLEPMLYNMCSLSVLSSILNDSNVKSIQQFKPFAATVMRHYARLAEQNPMVFVETLFRHPFPHRFCRTIMNKYVDEDNMEEGQAITQALKKDEEDHSDMEENNEIEVKQSHEPDKEDEEDSENDYSVVAPRRDNSPDDAMHHEESNEEMSHDDWDERHLFKGRRKRANNDEIGIVRERDEMNTNSQPTTKKKKRRLRKNVVADESDDDFFFEAKNEHEMISPPSAISTKQSLETDLKDDNRKFKESPANQETNKKMCYSSASLSVGENETNSSKLIFDDVVTDTSQESVLIDPNEGNTNSQISMFNKSVTSESQEHTSIGIIEREMNSSNLVFDEAPIDESQGSTSSGTNEKETNSSNLVFDKVTIEEPQESVSLVAKGAETNSSNLRLENGSIDKSHSSTSLDENEIDNNASNSMIEKGVIDDSKESFSLDVSEKHTNLSNLMIDKVDDESIQSFSLDVSEKNANSSNLIIDKLANDEPQEGLPSGISGKETNSSNLIIDEVEIDELA